MCLSRTCFSLDRRRKIWQYRQDSICRDPPVHNTSSFRGEKGVFPGKVRRLFSHTEYPRIISGQINKLEGTDLMDAKMLYEQNAALWGNSRTSQTLSIQLLLSAPPQYLPFDLSSSHLHSHHPWDLWAPLLQLQSPLLWGLSLLGTINHTILLLPLICVHCQLV